MKLTKRIILTLASMTYIATLFLSPLNLNTIYAKNISIFILIGIITFDITSGITNNAINRFKLTGTIETLAHILKIGVFSGILLVSSTFQLGMIEYNNTPVSKGCVFFDNYGNLIYTNKFSTGCAELEYLTSTDTELVFTATETYTRTLSSFSFSEEEDTQYDNVIFTSTNLVSTSITYDEDHRIVYVDKHESYLVETDASTREKSYYSSNHMTIENNYGDSFEQIIRESSIDEEYDSLNYFNLEHTDLSHTDYSTMRYYQVDLTDYSYEIHKEYTSEDTLINELYATIELSGDNYSITKNSVLVSSLEVREEFEIDDEEIIVNKIETDYDDEYSRDRTYLYNEDYGYIIKDQKGFYEDTGVTFDFLQSRDREYYVSSYHDSEYFNLSLDKKYFEFHRTEHGIHIDVLRFNEDSYLLHLFNKTENTETNKSFSFRYYLQDVSSIFDASYEYSYIYYELLYQTPYYIY